MRLCRLLLLQLLLLLQEVHPARNLITRGFVFGGRILKIIAMSAIFKYFLFKVILKVVLSSKQYSKMCYYSIIVHMFSPTPIAPTQVRNILFGIAYPFRG